MKEMLHAVRCLNSKEDMISWLEHCTGIAEVMGSNPVESPEFFRFMRQLHCPASARIISSFDFNHRTAYNILSAILLRSSPSLNFRPLKMRIASIPML